LKVKQGQIAHLNRDRSDSDGENLAFMCLEHHDWFDSKTSQSKGASIEEARMHRKELYDELRRRDEAEVNATIEAPILTSQTPASSADDSAARLIAKRDFVREQHASFEALVGVSLEKTWEQLAAMPFNEWINRARLEPTQQVGRGRDWMMLRTRIEEKLKAAQVVARSVEEIAKTSADDIDRLWCYPSPELFVPGIDTIVNPEFKHRYKEIYNYYMTAMPAAARVTARLASLAHSLNTRVLELGRSSS
jgi:hypothetical protein